MNRLFLIAITLALASASVADASPRPRNLRGGRSVSGRGVRTVPFRRAVVVDPGFGFPAFSVPPAVGLALPQAVTIVQQLADGTFVGSDGALYDAAGVQLLPVGSFAVRNGRVVGRSAAGRGRLARINRGGLARRGGLVRRGPRAVNRRLPGRRGGRVAPARRAPSRGGMRR